jgi:hypothetical protein
MPCKLGRKHNKDVQTETYHEIYGAKPHGIDAWIEVYGAYWA